MQTFKLLLITIFSFGSLFATAQTKTKSVKVLGNCGMCQGRIEKAAKAAGATTAKWNVATDVLTVSYNTTATSLSAIETKVASAGHDTHNKTASREAYNKLHDCCQYERKQNSASAASCCKEGASCFTDSGACCIKSASASTASAKDCCADGAACCKSGQDCCVKPPTALTTALMKDCCTAGATCCGSAQDCCSKATSVTASVTNCCTSGATCCEAGADCCRKSAVATTESSKECCAQGAECCAVGSACCTKHALAA